MQTARLSNKRQIIIPKSILEACQLSVGQELDIEITGQGILLKTQNTTAKTSLNDLIGCTGYQGKTKTLSEMDAAIQQGIMSKWEDQDSD